MDKATMMALVKDATGEQDESVISRYLDLAGEEVLNRWQPYRDPSVDLVVPPKYHTNQVRIATYMLDKRGAEGETSHTEGGITRNYGASDIPSGYFNGIVPMARALG